MLSSPDYIYLDHPYEPVGEERGKYWATSYTDTRKIFNFAPEELYEDIDKIGNCSGLKKCVDGRQNVLGKNNLTMKFSTLIDSDVFEYFSSKFNFL